MYKGSGPRLLPIIIVIIIAALIIAALVTVGRMIFGGDSDTTKSQDTDTVRNAVLDTTADRAVLWTVRGPIVANEDYRSYQILISPSERVYTIYSGYLDTVIKTQKYDNSVAAYEQFVYALDKANIGTTRNVQDTDIRGVCATGGLAYTFETLSSGSADHTLWSSTCKDSPGTMAADALQVHALFTNQIPDFKPLFNSIY